MSSTKQFAVPNPWTPVLQAAVLGWLLAATAVGEWNLTANGNRGRPITFWIAAIGTVVIPLIVGRAVVRQRFWSFYLMLAYLVLGAFVNIPRGVSDAIAKSLSWRASAGALTVIAGAIVGLLLVVRAWTIWRSSTEQSSLT